MIPADDRIGVLARRSLDEIASAAAVLLDVRFVLISLVEGPRQIPVGSYGFAAIGTHESSPLCRDVATTGRPIVLQDARRRLPDRARGTWHFDLVGYAGVALPLRDPDRGALAAITSVRRTWQSDNLDVLRCLAAAAASVLAMRARCDERAVDDPRTLRNRARPHP